MATANDANVHWQLGKFFGRKDRAVDVRYFRPVSDDEAQQLLDHSRVVRQLGSLTDFRSLTKAVQRWLDTVEQLQRRLAASETIPRTVITAGALDVAAIAHAALRCERGLVATAQRLRDDGHAEAEHVGAVDSARRQLQTRRGYLTLAGLRPDARAGQLGFVFGRDGLVRIEGVQTYTAAELGQMVLGEVIGFMVGAVGPLAEAIAGPIGELEGLLNDAPPGVRPDLLRVTGEARPSNVTASALAIPQATALREFTETGGELTVAQAVKALTATIDAGERSRLSVGSVGIDEASEGTKVSTAVNALPVTTFTIDPELLGSAPVDYWGAVTFDMTESDHRQRLFAGTVQNAAGADPLTVNCEGGIQLVEHNRGSIAIAGVETPEVIATIMRQAGLPEDTIVLSSSEPSPRPEEPFDVFIPVRGLAVTDPVTLGQVSIVTIADGHDPLAALDLTAELVQSLDAEYRDATAYAKATVMADSLDVAEDLGYAAVETAIAWLVTRQRYGLLRLPNGEPQTFSRIEAMQSVRYAPIALVRGQTSARQWLRWIQHPGEPLTRSLSPDSDLLQPGMPDELPTTDGRALRALMRASNEPGLRQQIEALAQALESYALGVKVPGEFSNEELDRLRAGVPEWLNEAQRCKLEKAIEGLNGSPFQRRLAERLDRDGVPLTDEERELLFTKFRHARNAVAHGYEIKKPPTRDEMLRGISIVSRALMFGAAAHADANAA